MFVLTFGTLWLLTKKKKHWYTAHKCIQLVILNKIVAAVVEIIKSGAITRFNKQLSVNKLNRWLCCQPAKTVDTKEELIQVGICVGSVN